MLHRTETPQRAVVVRGYRTIANIHNSFEIGESISWTNANVTFYAVRMNVLIPNSFPRERYTRVAL